MTHPSHGSHDDLPDDPDTEVDDTTAATRGARPAHFRPVFLLLVFLGGTIGTALRVAIGLVTTPVAKFPLATLAINTSGAFFLAFLLESLAFRGPDEGLRRSMRLFIGTGMMGGFTTYSTLVTDTAKLSVAGNAGIAMSYAVGTLVLGVIASIAGIALASLLTPARKRVSS